jgi:hypothetical protein
MCHPVFSTKEFVQEFIFRSSGVAIEEFRSSGVAGVQEEKPES